MNKKAWIRSGLLKTWPFLRASLIRFGVGCSVLSPGMAPASWSKHCYVSNELIQLLQHSGEEPGHAAEDVRHSQQNHSQPQQRLHRLTLAVHAQSRGHLAKHPEADVHQEQRQ